MALNTYTFAEWVDRARAVIRAAIPEAVTTRGTDYYLTARLLALLATNAQGMASYILKQILPKTAEREWLQRHAEARKIATLPATKATGYVQILGTGGSSQANATINAPDGTVYTLDSVPVTIALPAWVGKTSGTGSGVSRLVILPDTSGMLPGHVLSVTIDAVVHTRTIRDVLTSVNAVDLYEALPSAPVAGSAVSAVAGARAAVTAAAVGAKSNRDVGEAGTLQTPGAGVTAAVTFLGLSGGADVETLEELRGRIVDFDAYRPAAGNAAHYREIAKSIKSHRVAEAFVFPGFRGLGTINVVPFGISGARMPSQSMIDAVQDALDAAAHWADDILVHAFTYTAPMDCLLLAGWHPGHEPDWEGALTIGGGVSTTSRIYTTTNPALSGVAIGARVNVSVQVSGTWQWCERTVAAMTATYIDLSSPLPAVPANGKSVCSGGPGVTLLHDALVDYFDQLGPGAFEVIVGLKLEAGVARMPPVSDSFDGTVRLDQLRARLFQVPGLASLTIVQLNGTVGPTSDIRVNPGEVALLGEVKIQSFSGF